MTDSALGPIMADIEGLTLTPEDREFLCRPAIGGIILFSRNYDSPEQLKTLTASIKDLRPNILIAVDQEGGRVQRFREGFLTLPPLRSIGVVFEEDPNAGLALAECCGWAMAAEVIHHGVDFSFAPVLDLFDNSSKVIKERAFSHSVDSVVRLVRAYVTGMNRAGMAATGKHYPGHGSVVADSHFELPVDDRSAEDILSTDFRVFSESLSCLSAVMPAHVKYPAIDAHCAGFSPVWIKEKLRDELGFRGVVFSDDLTMAAASDGGDIYQRVEKALMAGCNMILVCNDRSVASAACDCIEDNSLTQSSDDLDDLTVMLAREKPKLNLYDSDEWVKACALIEPLVRKI